MVDYCITSRSTGNGAVSGNLTAKREPRKSRIITAYSSSTGSRFSNVCTINSGEASFFATIIFEVSNKQWKWRSISHISLLSSTKTCGEFLVGHDSRGSSHSTASWWVLQTVPVVWLCAVKSEVGKRQGQVFQKQAGSEINKIILGTRKIIIIRNQDATYQSNVIWIER